MIYPNEGSYEGAEGHSLLWTAFWIVAPFVARTRLEERMAQEAAEPPPVMRLVLVFLPLIGIPNLLSQARRTGDLSWAVGAGVVIAGAMLAALGFFVLGAWFARQPRGPARTIMGWGIVLGCYLLLFATYGVLLFYAG